MTCALKYLTLTREGPERLVSCQARHYFTNARHYFTNARHYFTNARKMLWSCEGQAHFFWGINYKMYPNSMYQTALYHKSDKNELFIPP